MDGMTPPTTDQTADHRADPTGRQAVDRELAKAIRHALWYRRVFYLVVLLVALAGQVSGAVETLHIPLFAAIPAVGALELGGVVVLANADVRRRLGEHAIASRALSAAIAAWAVAFNWLAHAEHLLGGFFAGMSALGYLVWLMHTENQRRDRLRAKGDLPPTAPAYGAWRWIRHPGRTARARAFALADPTLGLYGSLKAVEVVEEITRQRQERRRREAAIATVLQRKIAASADPRAAEIAITVYDLDEIARRLAASADYDGLTALVAADLIPARLLADPTDRTGSTNRVPPAGAMPTIEADHPTSEQATTVRSVPARKSTTRPTIRPTDQATTGRRLRVVGEPAAVANARRLREMYGDNLPTVGRQIRGETGWSPDRVSAAVEAYNAGLDLKADRESGTPSGESADGDRGDDERRPEATEAVA